MAWFNNFFGRRKMRKQEIHADEQYLDALEIIKESMEIYLDLISRARQDDDEETCARLDSKLNSNFEYFNKSWNGEIRIVHTVVANCVVTPEIKRLKLE